MSGWEKPDGHARVLVGPGRGHRFELPSRSVLYRMRNRGSLALGRYEAAVTAFLAERLPSSAAFFDIGAHTGYFTRVALTVMPRAAKVVAFEPDAMAAVRLRGSFNDLRLSVRVEAIGREDHLAVLQRRDGLASRIRGESIASDGFADSGEVVVRSLDGLLDAHQIPIPDIVKIDVEGGELLALEGMRRLLQMRPAMAVECHSMPLLRDVLELLLSCGYGHVEVTRGGDRVGPPTVLAAAAS